MVAGDSLLVMNSLLEKEGMAGKVQMVYIDPPYGIKYGSNFQPFVNKRDVKDGKDEDLTAEPEQIRAFRDTWELGIHSYLTYLRDRLLLARELLTESGSIFVQISDENVHHVRELMDEVYGRGKFYWTYQCSKNGWIADGYFNFHCRLPRCWYSKDKKQVDQHIIERRPGDTSLDRYDMIEEPDGTLRRISHDERLSNKLPSRYRRLQLTSMESANPFVEFIFEDKRYWQRWKTNEIGLLKLAIAKRLYSTGNKLRYKRYVEDFPVIPLTDRWDSVQIGTELYYVVQIAPNVIQRCLLMGCSGHPCHTTAIIDRVQRAKGNFI